MAPGIYSGYGIPENYTNNAMYQYYMMQLMQQQQQQALWQRQQALLAERQQSWEQSMIQQGQVDTYQPQQVINPQPATIQVQQTNTPVTAQPVQPAQAGDGKDDGKISFGKKCKNFFKGVGNFFKGLVCDKNGKFSLKQTLKTAAVAVGAAVLTVVTYGAATPYLVAAGCAMAAYQTGKGVYKACKAKTDREAEQAWQDIGCGTTGIVASVAGAKGALKSAGVAVPKGNALTSSLRATGECFNIAGKGLWNAKGAMMHPMKTLGSLRGYWNTTAKPNLLKAFSSKNWRSNYTRATGESLNKDIANLDMRINDINTQLTKLRAANSEANASQITKLEASLAELNNNKVLLTQQKAYLTEGGAQNIVTRLKNDLAVAEERLATATGNEKSVLSADIKSMESQLKFYESNLKLENAYARISRSDAVTRAWEARMKQPGVTEWQRGTMQAHIQNAKAYGFGAKNTLRLSNMKLAVQQHLPKVGLGYGSYYLSGAAPQTINDEYAQLYGFESKDQMIEAADQYGVSVEQLADAIDQQLAAQGVTAADFAQQQATPQTGAMQQVPPATNPVSQFAYSQPMQFMGDNSSRFNELYQSPYSGMIA